MELFGFKLVLHVLLNSFVFMHIVFVLAPSSFDIHNIYLVVCKPFFFFICTIQEGCLYNHPHKAMHWVYCIWPAVQDQVILFCLSGTYSLCNNALLSDFDEFWCVCVSSGRRGTDVFRVTDIFFNTKSTLWIIFLNPNPVCDPNFLFILFVASSRVYVQLSAAHNSSCWNFNTSYTFKNQTGFRWQILTMLFVWLIHSPYYVNK